MLHIFDFDTVSGTIFIILWVFVIYTNTPDYFFVDFSNNLVNSSTSYSNLPVDGFGTGIYTI